MQLLLCLQNTIIHSMGISFIVQVALALRGFTLCDVCTFSQKKIELSYSLNLRGSNLTD